MALPHFPGTVMTLMVAGVACLAVTSVWHVCLALLSAREASRWVAGATAACDHGHPDGGSSAAPSFLWLVLINPAPATLAAVRAAGLRLRCRLRAVVVESDLSRHACPDPADVHRLVVSPRSERAEVLNRAYRLIRARCRDYGEDPARTVVGVIDAGAVPDEGLPVAVWRAFREPSVGAVQARVQISGAGAFGAAEQYERGVLADAVNLLRSRRGRAQLGVNGAFVRLSALSRLGPRPWRPGEPEDYGLGRRLRRLSVLVRHCPDVRVLARGTDQRDIVRQYTCVVQGRLSAWPSPLRRLRGERLSWAQRVVAWPLPGLVVMWVLAAVAAAAWRLVEAAPEPVAGAARWSTLLWTAMAMDTPSWLALLQAAALWTAAAVAPIVAWWVARRDLAVGDLLRGALGRPLLLLARPVAFGLAFGRSMVGLRVVDPIGEPTGQAPPTGVGRRRTVAVFVDATGRRRRRLWTVAYGMGVAGLAYVVVFGFALVGQQVSPPGGVGAPPAIGYPTPTPTPPATLRPTHVEASVAARGGGGAAGRFADPARADGPPSQPSPSGEPSPSDEPTQSGEPSPSDEPTPSGEPSPSDESSASPEPSPSPSPSVSETEDGPPPPSPSPSESTSDGDGAGAVMPVTG